MSAYYFGLSVTSGLLALLPSQLENQRAVPVFSIILAVLSGVFAGIAASFHA